MQAQRTSQQKFWIEVLQTAPTAAPASYALSKTPLLFLRLRQPCPPTALYCTAKRPNTPLLRGDKDHTKIVDIGLCGATQDQIADGFEKTCRVVVLQEIGGIEIMGLRTVKCIGEN